MATKTKTTKSHKALNIRMFRGMAKADIRQTKILSALGLRKSGAIVQHDDSPTIRGMLSKVAHLVEVTTND